MKISLIAAMKKSRKSSMNRIPDNAQRLCFNRCMFNGWDFFGLVNDGEHDIVIYHNPNNNTYGYSKVCYNAVCIDGYEMASFYDGKVNLSCIKVMSDVVNLVTKASHENIEVVKRRMYA